MLQLVKQIHYFATMEKLEVAPEKAFFMLLNVKCLGHEIGFETIENNSFQNGIKSKKLLLYSISNVT